MHPRDNMVRIIGRKRYSVATSDLIADDEYWDGHNFERQGRNTFLYRTKGGAYFVVTLSMWQGERETLEPVGLAQALDLYENSLLEHYVAYHKAFPEIEVTDA